MKFYLLICNDKFYLFDENRKIVHMDANPFFEYEPNKIFDATGRLLEKIVDENNLSNSDELQFILIGSNDNVRNESAAKKLGNLVVKNLPIGDLMKKTILNLAEDKNLYIEELGVNYDGESYHLEDGKIWRGDYSLLALSIDPSEIMKFVD